MYRQNFGNIFFFNKAKNVDIAVVLTRLYNEIEGKKKPKFPIDNCDLVLKSKEVHLMKNLKPFLFSIAMLLCTWSYAQNDTLPTSGFANIVTLIVDANTFDYQGGNFTYYPCTGCTNDSLPFITNYEYTVYEYSASSTIAFQLDPTMDTVFLGTTIFRAWGRVIHPERYHLEVPFLDIGTEVERPADIQFFDFFGDKHSTSDSLINQLVDEVWEKVKTLEITNIFADRGFKSGIYGYSSGEPPWGYNLNKWIVFLYFFAEDHLSDDFLTSLDQPFRKPAEWLIYPNPATDRLQIEPLDPAVEFSYYRIFDNSGKRIISDRAAPQQQNSIDVSDLPAGVYYLQLLDASGYQVAIEKVVKE